MSDKKHSKTSDPMGKAINPSFSVKWNSSVRSNVEWNSRCNNSISPLMVSLEEVEKGWRSRSRSWTYLLHEEETLPLPWWEGFDITSLSPGDRLFQEWVTRGRDWMVSTDQATLSTFWWLSHDSQSLHALDPSDTRPQVFFPDILASNSLVLSYPRPWPSGPAFSHCLPISVYPSMQPIFLPG